MIVKTSIKDIYDIIVDFFPDFKVSSNPFQDVIVYKIDDEIVGFIIYSVIYERTEIDYIAVREDYRGKGVSKELLDYFLSSLDRCENVSLEVNCNNVRAINFYLKNGFKRVSVRKNYYDGSDGILMVKDLEVN